METASLRITCQGDGSGVAAASRKTHRGDGGGGAREITAPREVHRGDDSESWCKVMMVGRVVH